MGVGGGIDDDAVIQTVGPLDLVHDGPLMIGLEEVRLDVLLFADFPDKIQKSFIGLASVDVFFPDPQHIQIGTVDDQKFHGFSSPFP